MTDKNLPYYIIITPEFPPVNIWKEFTRTKAKGYSAFHFCSLYICINWFRSFVYQPSPLDCYFYFLEENKVMRAKSFDVPTMIRFLESVNI